jgi:hypothetical protein
MVLLHVDVKFYTHSCFIVLFKYFVYSRWFEQFLVIGSTITTCCTKIYCFLLLVSQECSSFLCVLSFLYLYVGDNIIFSYFYYIYKL